MTRYLKQRPHGHAFLWTPELAKRPDMVEVASLEDPLPPDPRDAPPPSFFAPSLDDDPVTRVSDDGPDPAPAVPVIAPPVPRRRRKDPLAEMLASTAVQGLEIDSEGQGF